VSGARIYATYGEAESLARAKDTTVKRLRDSGIVLAQAGKVRLRTITEIAAYPPEVYGRTLWGVTHRIIGALEHEGEAAAAAVLAGHLGMRDQVRALATWLYRTCEVKGWASCARHYNGLIVAWPEIEMLAHEGGAHHGL
jgi:putative DNA methylase